MKAGALKQLSSKCAAHKGDCQGRFDSAITSKIMNIAARRSRRIWLKKGAGTGERSHCACVGASCHAASEAARAGETGTEGS